MSACPSYTDSHYGSMDLTEHPPTTTTPTSSSSSTNFARPPPRDSLLRRRTSRRDQESSSSAVTDDEKEDDAVDDDRDEDEGVLSDATRLAEAVRGLAVAPGLVADLPLLDHMEQPPAVAARGVPEEAAPETLYDADDEGTSVPASPVVAPVVCEVDEIYKVEEGIETQKETSAESEAAELGANTNTDEKFCRICLAGADDMDESLGKLFSPCLCSGTIIYAQSTRRFGFNQPHISAQILIYLLRSSYSS
ncbi:hypothetical protein BC937DRAFT_87218 [Endogone sp. FLAS-F59071]|nr:hypothetical protein BC937DRAFT_87218 [Endogone sp. FLAS-F59071]|eukprot:RUS19601.1 hypothetical protein BC937DRAFT_87218 [Endogone sp. FLAS-F59071]